MFVIGASAHYGPRVSSSKEVEASAILFPLKEASTRDFSIFILLMDAKEVIDGLNKKRIGLLIILFWTLIF